MSCARSERRTVEILSLWGRHSKIVGNSYGSGPADSRASQESGPEAAVPNGESLRFRSGGRRLFADSVATPVVLPWCVLPSS